VPIHIGFDVRRMADDEFKECAYEVMSQVFEVQEELGRLFHESIYQQELAFRIMEARREVPIEVWSEDFCKTYYLDLLVCGGAIFELKAVESLTERHRRQLLQYLFLTDMPHGKLVNLRPERVQHEFINSTLTRADRVSFDVDDGNWMEFETTHLKQSMVNAIRDWGTGLDIGLYEELAAFVCGQPADREATAEIRLGGRTVGNQPIRLASPYVALRITALPTKRQDEYETHLGRFLACSNLHAIQWINITRQLVRFKTIVKK